MYCETLVTKPTLLKIKLKMFIYVCPLPHHHIHIIRRSTYLWHNTRERIRPPYLNRREKGKKHKSSKIKTQSAHRNSNTHQVTPPASCFILKYDVMMSCPAKNESTLEETHEARPPRQEKDRGVENKQEAPDLDPVVRVQRTRDGSLNSDTAKPLNT